MVSVDGSRAPVDTYLAENGYTMPVVLDNHIEVASKFGVSGTPTTFIVNREGKIVASGFGALDFDHPELRNYLQTLIEEPPSVAELR
jgi:hypothetical protein